MGLPIAESLFHEQRGMTSSGDMAYTYGKVKALNKSDQKPVTLNYLRIWKKEGGKNWKIVLDVIEESCLVLIVS